MPQTSFDEALEKILKTDSRYPREAYFFIREALDHTQETRGKETTGRIRHVSGQELLEGIREYALSEYGPMTITVFAEWGIRVCRDFGELVFNLIDAGFLAKTESDSREDFDEGYSFEEAFRIPFLPSSKRAPQAGEPKPTRV